MANKTKSRAIFVNASIEAAAWVKYVITQAIMSTEEYSDTAKQQELTHIYSNVVDDAIHNGLCIVALESESKALLGVCFAEHDSGTVWLSWIATHPRYRDQGIGTGLVNAMCDKITIEEHASKICCSSLMSNIASAKMLEKCGFSKIVELRKHWHGLDYFLWEKFL